MTDATPILPTQQRSLSPGYTPISADPRGLSMELAKCLKLVAPASMAADAQLSWLAAAVDALVDIRPDEVAAISAELRRSVTRPAQIVPEISRMVAERRSRLRRAEVVNINPQASLFRIEREGRARMERAKTPREIEDAQEWERREMLNAGLEVRDRADPLTREELENLPADIRSMGLAYGFLAVEGGKLVERNPADAA